MKYLSSFISHLKEIDWKKLPMLLWQWLTAALSRNIGFKALAVVLALILWAGLIAQDPSLIRSKVFQNVPVAVNGQETLKRNGYIVISNLNDVVTPVTVEADVPQAQHAAAQASSYNIRVDLSRISQAGLQDVRILSNNSSLYGSVTSITPSSVQLEIDEYLTRYRIPVSIVQKGEIAEGFAVTPPSYDPSYVTISGPRSVLSRIVRVVADLDLSVLPAQEGTIRTALPFRLVDQNNETVESELLEVTSQSVLLDSIIVEQTVYAAKTILLSDVGIIKGNVRHGYEIKSLRIVPEMIRAIGTSDALTSVDRLFADAAVDVTNAEKTFQQAVRIRKPSELYALSTDTISVEVIIGEASSSRTVDKVKLSLTGIPDGMRAVTDTKQVSATMIGTVLTLESVQDSKITATADVSALTEEGVYWVPVRCEAKTGNGQSVTIATEPSAIQVTVRKK